MGDPKLRTYSAASVIQTFGTHTITGSAPDTFVTIAPGGDAFSTVQSADGSVNRSNNNMFWYIVTIILSQTSPSNKILSDIHNADKVSNIGVFPYILNDLNGNTLFTAPLSYIARESDIEDAKELGTRTWIFNTGIAVNIIGGNNGVDGEV